MKRILLTILILILLAVQNPLYSNRPSSEEEWTEVNYNDNCVKIYYKYNTENGVYFSIKSPHDINYEIEMYDIFGRKVVDKTVEFSTVFNKSNIAKGLYCLRIHKQDTVTNRLIYFGKSTL